MHVLILGAGQIGSRLAQVLVSQSIQVTAVRRTSVAIAGVQCLAQDIHQLNLTGIAPIHRVFVIVSADDSSETAYRHSYVDAIPHISRQLALHPTERIVVVSSSRVAHENAGGAVDEFSAVDIQRLSECAHVLYQAELTWRTYWGDRLIVVRPSGIYGSDRLRLIQWVKSAKSVPTEQWTNRIHEDDVVGFLAFIANMDAKAPVATLYYVSDSQPILLNELLDELADLMHMPRLKTEASEKVSGKKIMNTRLARSGYQLKYPTWRAGYTDILNTLSRFE